VIATVSTSITVGAGILMTVADHKAFRRSDPDSGGPYRPSRRSGTATRTGDCAGRLVASLVMLVGIGFLTVITAAITSTFVSRSRGGQTPFDAATPTAEQLRQIAARLERIEAALTVGGSAQSPRELARRKAVATRDRVDLHLGITPPVHSTPRSCFTLILRGGWLLSPSRRLTALDSVGAIHPTDH